MHLIFGLKLVFGSHTTQNSKLCNEHVMCPVSTIGFGCSSFSIMLLALLHVLAILQVRYNPLLSEHTLVGYLVYDHCWIYFNHISVRSPISGVAPIWPTDLNEDSRSAVWQKILNRFNVFKSTLYREELQSLNKFLNICSVGRQIFSIIIHPVLENRMYGTSLVKII